MCIGFSFLLAQLTQGQQVALWFAFAIAGFAVGAGIKTWIERSRRQQAEQQFESRRVAVEAEAQKILAEAKAEAQTEMARRREKFEADTETTRQELRDEERRLAKREDLLDEKLESLNAKERQAEAAERAAAEREKALAAKDDELNRLLEQRKSELLRVSEMTVEQARQTVLQNTEEDMEREIGLLIQRRIDEANETAETEARNIIVSAIQRYAADHTSETTVSAVEIPNDEMKGRVIGREGRNIRAFEKATGVDVIVDDTPGVVVVSSFDAVRREIARRSLEKLIQDGRIHPTRIEEIVAATEKDLNREILDHGKQALVEANVRGLHNKLVQLLGRLHFRTSYGQNVLRHAIEVSYLSQVIADELGLNSQLARRCGLLHDIGKAVDHEVEGTHPDIGADLCRRYGEKDEVVNAVGGHHGDLEVTSIFTPIIAAADAISASRPGARRESLERYIQRLQKLEGIATSFEGVHQAYAIQAGREVRVLVDAEQVDDRLTSKIARDMAKRIEEEMEYPGEVKVTLVREMRCVEYAR
jgi:ribonuclease Y